MPGDALMGEPWPFEVRRGYLGVTLPVNIGNLVLYLLELRWVPGLVNLWLLLLLLLL